MWQAGEGRQAGCFCNERSLSFYQDKPRHHQHNTISRDHICPSESPASHLLQHPTMTICVSSVGSQKFPYLQLHLPLEKFYIHLNVGRNNFDLIKSFQPFSVIILQPRSASFYLVLLGAGRCSHFNVHCSM